jgi:hypothetical protein
MCRLPTVTHKSERLPTHVERREANHIEAVIQVPGPLNILGWTVRADERGRYKAFRKINGRTRSIYLGRSLDGAEAKIRAWEESQAGPHD